jgi:hypothetical protein
LLFVALVGIDLHCTLLLQFVSLFSVALTGINGCAIAPPFTMVGLLLNEPGPTRDYHFGPKPTFHFPKMRIVQRLQSSTRHLPAAVGAAPRAGVQECWSNAIFVHHRYTGT